MHRDVLNESIRHPVLQVMENVAWMNFMSFAAFFHRFFFVLRNCGLIRLHAYICILYTVHMDGTAF